MLEKNENLRIFASDNSYMKAKYSEQSRSERPHKETRSDQVVLADPFETRPFENSAMCSWCYKNMSVKVQVKAIRMELINAKPNYSKNLDTCFDCKK